MFNGLLLPQSTVAIEHPCIEQLQYWRHRDKEVYLVNVEFDIAHFEFSLYKEFDIRAPQQLRNAVKKRQAEFLMGRLAAKHALHCIEFDVPNITIGINKNRAPVWPSGIAGSISHDKSTVICVLAKQIVAPMLGVDIECLLNETVARQICLTVHNQQEQGLLHDLGVATNIVTTLLFSAKESLFKALYPKVQSYFGFEQARLSQVDLQQQFLIFRLEASFANKYNLERYHKIRYQQLANKLITLIT